MKPGATAAALGAIVLWGTVAALATRLATVPPFLLTGIALLVGALVGAKALLQPPPPWPAMLLGLYGLFAYHLCLFLALRHAPPVEANLLNYLWPLLIVVLAPLFVPAVRWSVRHALAAVLGFSGAVLLVGLHASPSGSAAGYGLAVAAAFIWSTYSLLTRRFSHFPTAYVSWFCLVSGVAAMLCHFVLEPAHIPTAAEWPWLLALGVGPMGAAFFLWDRAMKAGDPRVIGNLAYLTPLLSTLLLVAVGGGEFSATTLVAMGLILGGAALGAAAPRA